MNQKSLKNNQGLTYIIIGILNTIADFAILFGLKFLGINEILANIASTGLTFISSFILNRKYTFKSESKTKKEVFREMVLFTIVTLFSVWVIQTIVIKTTMPIIAGFTTSESIVLLVAKTIATGFSMTWNYILYKTVVFKEKK